MWDIALFWHTYQYIIREKKKRGFSLCWIQILWITWLQQHTLHERKHELKDLIHTHKPFFVQLWSIDTIAISSPEQYKDNIYAKSIATMRTNLQYSITSWGFVKSSKENLPPSTYIIHITDWQDVLREHVSSGHQTKIKKAQKKWVIVREWTSIDYKQFAVLLQKTWRNKWFGTISSSVLENILSYWEKHNNIKLYIATLHNNIIAWAIYIHDKEADMWVYLYWATDRTYNNIWASHLLHREIWHILAHTWVTTIDLLWWWPTGDATHHLTNVWIFKEWFGWKKIDYVWSFDIVYNNIIYKMWKLLRGMF